MTLQESIMKGMDRMINARNARITELDALVTSMSNGNLRLRAQNEYLAAQVESWKAMHKVACTDRFITQARVKDLEHKISKIKEATQ